jgi:predicted  nucleic acid-binding Zn-ribbon protein
MLFNVFRKKEKQNMPTSTTTSAAQTKLTQQVSRQRDKINYLNGRLSDLVDEIHLLRNEIKHFKEDVAHDVQYLTERVDNENS